MGDKRPENKEVNIFTTIPHQVWEYLSKKAIEYGLPRKEVYRIAIEAGIDTPDFNLSCMSTTFNKEVPK